MCAPPRWTFSRFLSNTIRLPHATQFYLPRCVCSCEILLVFGTGAVTKRHPLQSEKEASEKSLLQLIATQLWKDEDVEVPCGNKMFVVLKNLADPPLSARPPMPVRCSYLAFVRIAESISSAARRPKENGVPGASVQYNDGGPVRTVDRQHRQRQTLPWCAFSSALGSLPSFAQTITDSQWHNRRSVTFSCIAARIIRTTRALS